MNPEVGHRMEHLYTERPGDHPNPGIKPASTALAGGFFTAEPAERPITINSLQRCSCQTVDIIVMAEKQNYDFIFFIM